MSPTRQVSSASSPPRLSLFLVILFSLHSAQGASVPAAISRSIRHQLLPARIQDTQSPPEIKTLELGQSFEREIAGGQKHSYEILLSEGQYMRVEIKPQGVNLGVTLQLPDGEIRQLFQPFESQPDLRLGEVAEKAGRYRLNVYTLPNAPAGRYQIRLAALHTATAKEQALEEGRKLFFESFRLHKQGQNAKALPLMLRSVEIREKELGPDDMLVAVTLGPLANIYDELGDNATAEALNLRALKIREKILGPDHPDVAKELVQLGSFYLNKGDYSKAEEIEQRVLRIYEKAQLLETPFAAAAFDNLGRISYEQGYYQNSEKYYEQSRAVWQKLLGPDHFHLAPSYTHLGRVAYDAGDYLKAEAMFQRALSLSEKALGPEHKSLTGYLNDLAMLFCTTAEYAKGEDLYRRAISINERNGAMAQLKAQETLFGLARCFAAEGRSDEAVKFQSQASEIEEHYIGLNLAVGSEREKLAVLASLASRLSRNISLHTDVAPNDPAARNLAALSIVERKGRIQDAMSASLGALRQRLGAEDQKLLDQLNDSTTRLANLVLNGPQKTTPAAYQKEVKALEEERENLEAEISSRSAGSYERSSHLTLTALQAAIPEHAVLVEFAVYRPFDAKAPDNQKAYGAPRYVAYILHRQGEVQWKDLGTAKAIDDVVDSLRQALHDPARSDVQRLARAVDERVMQPIRPLIGDKTQLLISPEGQLNLLPFAALVDEQMRYLVEHYLVTYLTSGRDLLRLQVGRQSKNPPVVVADPAFGDPALLAEREASHRNGGTKTSSPSRLDYSQMFFGPLPGVSGEVRALKQLLPNARFITGEQANKAELERLVAPIILHIATHGFFLSEPGSEESARVATRGINVHAKIENPLLRSGLALAGANRSGGSGILTALEASGLNLWGTKLVVLSACDTGVGQVRNGEGVYGLRRALVLAGAESQVMSLWPVSDRSTRDLMIGYYRNLTSGKGRGDSLRQAQLQMLQNKSRSHPYYWASFIQTGEWANLEGKR